MKEIAFYLGIKDVKTGFDAIDTLSFITVEKNDKVKYVDETRMSAAVYSNNDQDGAVLFIVGKFTPDEIVEIKKLGKYYYAPIQPEVTKTLSDNLLKLKASKPGITHEIIGAYSGKTKEEGIPKRKQSLSKREKVIADAELMWESRHDPKLVPLGTYLCDACGAPIQDKRGTSYFGGWTRCAKCTDKTFPLEPAPVVTRTTTKEPVTTTPASKTRQSPREYKPKTQPCKKCGKLFEKGILTCPHCGWIDWGTIFASLFFGLLLLFICGVIINNDGSLFWIIVLGIIGAIMFIFGIVEFKRALKSDHRENTKQ